MAEPRAEGARPVDAKTDQEILDGYLLDGICLEEAERLLLLHRRTERARTDR
jgi:hypothetical protein